jgi:hypothetical protein
MRKKTGRKRIAKGRNHGAAHHRGMIASPIDVTRSGARGSGSTASRTPPSRHTRRTPRSRWDAWVRLPPGTTNVRPYPAIATTTIADKRPLSPHQPTAGAHLQQAATATIVTVIVIVIVIAGGSPHTAREIRNVIPSPDRRILLAPTAGAAAAENGNLRELACSRRRRTSPPIYSN